MAAMNKPNKVSTHPLDPLRCGAASFPAVAYLVINISLELSGAL
jgi:hypothetical protein